MASAAAERYLSSLPIEDQQAIRAGGDVDAWYNAAVQAGAVPQNFGGTAATTKPWWEMSAQEAGINPWQQDYKQEFATMTPQKLAQMSPEQRARWSMEHLDALDYRSRQSAFDQWMAWQDSFDPSCPPSAPYRAGDGSGCVEKPDNSNAGYQDAAGQGGAGGGGGVGRGQTGSQNLNSPLRDLLINQGGFLSGQDQTRGDDKPGVKGGIVGGGGIWWQPTQTLAQPAGIGPSTGLGPATAPGSIGWNNPNIQAGAGLEGPQSTSVNSARPALAPGGTSTNAIGWNNPNVQAGAGLTGPQNWAGRNKKAGMSQLGPLGQGLTGMMSGLQGQGGQYSPLGSMMAPYQRNRRASGSWFGG